MAEQKSCMTPEVMAALKKKSNIARRSKDAVDMFAGFTGPLGRFIARLQRASFGFSKKTGNMYITVFHTCLAQMPDSSSSNKPDLTFAGAPMKVFINTDAGPKTTEDDQWNRVMVLLQAYDIKTKNFGIRNGKEVQDDNTTFWTDFGAAVDMLTQTQPAVMIEHTESKPNEQGKVYRNLNVRERIAEEVASKFGKSKVTVEDADMLLPEGEGEGSSSSAPSPVVVQYVSEAEATEALASFSPEDLLLQLEETLTAGQFAYHCPLNTLSYEQQKELAFAVLTGKEIPVFDTNLQSASIALASADLAAKLEADKLNVPTSSGINQPIGIMTSSPADDDDEETGKPDDDEEEDAGASLMLKWQLAAGTMDRAKLKKEIRLAGGITPEGKFTSDKTDDDLRNWLIGLRTGTVPPVIVQMPSEIQI